MKKSISEIASKVKAKASGLAESVVSTSPLILTTVKDDGTLRDRRVNSLEAASTALDKGAKAARSTFGSIADAVADGTRKSVTISKKSASTAGVAAKVAIDATGAALVTAGKATKRTATTIATTILDQNGDGILDQEDVRLMTEKGISVAKDGAREGAALVKDAASSGLAKEAAAGALVGAAVASVVPFIGTGAGAVVGAALGTYSHLTKK